MRTPDRAPPSGSPEPKDRGALPWDVARVEEAAALRVQVERMSLDDLADDIAATRDRMAALEQTLDEVRTELAALRAMATVLVERAAHNEEAQRDLEELREYITATEEYIVAIVRQLRALAANATAFADRYRGRNAFPS